MPRELDQLTSATQDMIDSIAFSVWKVCPWRARNREWLAILLQGYFACLFGGFLLACVLNSVEGERWLKGGGPHQRVGSKGGTALDECFWYIICTMHGIGYGDFMPRGSAGRIIGMCTISLGYWFVIFLCSIVMLSQLPGERSPGLMKTASHMISAVWPSYVVFVFVILVVGAQCGPYISEDRGYGRNDLWTGMYWIWQVAHRMPFGDLWPNTSFARTVTIPTAILGLLYMPYCMALVAVRCPSMAQHEMLLGELRKHPEDSMGRGYVVPSAGLTSQTEMRPMQG